MSYMKIYFPMYVTNWDGSWIPEPRSGFATVEQAMVECVRLEPDNRGWENIVPSGSLPFLKLHSRGWKLCVESVILHV